MARGATWDLDLLSDCCKAFPPRGRGNPRDWAGLARMYNLAAGTSYSIGSIMLKIKWNAIDGDDDAVVPYVAPPRAPGQRYDELGVLRLDAEGERIRREIRAEWEAARVADAGSEASEGWRRQGA